MAQRGLAEGQQNGQIAVLLTPSEVAAALRVDTKTLANWRFKGTGPTFLKVSGLVRYSTEDIQSFLAAARHQMTGHPLPPKPKPKEVYR